VAAAWLRSGSGVAQEHSEIVIVDERNEMLEIVKLAG
jgi:hypothetical protein